MNIEVVVASSSPTLLSIPSHSSNSERPQISSVFNLGKAVTLAISPSFILAFSTSSIPKNPTSSQFLTPISFNTKLSRLGNLPNGGKTFRFPHSMSSRSCNLVNAIIQFGKTIPPYLLIVSLSKSEGGCKTSIKLLSSWLCLKFNSKQSRRFLFLSCASAASSMPPPRRFSITSLPPILAALLSFSPPPHTIKQSNVRRHVNLSIPFGMKATPELSIRRCLNLMSLPVARGNSLRTQHRRTFRDCRLHKSHMVSGRDTSFSQPSKFRKSALLRLESTALQQPPYLSFQSPSRNLEPSTSSPIHLSHLVVFWKHGTIQETSSYHRRMPHD
uniref:Uncharacterized protein n=1 Tax=Salix viminalis TaxID=40686 RepID=A0A6N2LLP0_SALVM